MSDLEVESFEVSKEQAEVGTVRAEETFTCQPATCIDYTCVGNTCPTFEPTCEHYGSCNLSCGGTCDGDTCVGFTCQASGCQQTPCMACPT